MNKIFLLFLFASLFHTTQAQEMERQVVASSGHFMEVGNLSLSATLGETIVATFDEASGITLSQGFQQASLIVTNTYEPFADLDFQVFPNPTVAQVLISTSAEEDLTAEIFDLTGQVLMQKKLIYPIDQAPLSLDQLPAAHYFLKIMDKTGKSIFITSIQKIN